MSPDPAAPLDAHGASRRTAAEPSIAAHTALNLGGLLAPAVALLAAMPLLNRHFGISRVGFLTLAWAFIGYASLFDLGIGRALTKLASEKLAHPAASVADLVWTAMVLVAGLGAAGGLLVGLSATRLVSVLGIPSALEHEAATAVRILAVCLPIVMTTAGLRGLLEAQGRFLTSNMIRAPLGVWLFAGPLLLVPSGTRSLAAVAGVLLLGRAVAWVAYATACLRGLPRPSRRRPSYDAGAARQLLRFGAWMTVSNVVSPLMVYMDRFLIGSRVSLPAVAWYATPFEVVTKMLLLPSAMVAVLFPLLSALLATRDPRAARLHRDAVRDTIGLLLVPAGIFALFAREGLSAWLGPEFAAHATESTRWLALGCLLNGVAAVPFAWLQAAGRPEMTAKIHLAELPVYAFLVIVLTDRLGITGMALAWCIRATLDLGAMRYAAWRLGATTTSLAELTLPLSSLALAIPWGEHSWRPRGALLALLLVWSALAAWRIVGSLLGAGRTAAGRDPP